MSKKVFDPDWDVKCMNCGQMPTVTVNGDNEKFNSELCGPCYFVTAKAVDPDEWEGCLENK